MGLTIVGARIVGQGSRASADIYPSDSTEINFESFREFGTFRTLAREIAVATGAEPALKGQQVIEALVLLRRIAERYESFKKADRARKGGRVPAVGTDPRGRHEGPRRALGGVQRA